MQYDRFPIPSHLWHQHIASAPFGCCMGLLLYNAACDQTWRKSCESLLRCLRHSLYFFSMNKILPLLRTRCLRPNLFKNYQSVTPDHCQLLPVVKPFTGVQPLYPPSCLMPGSLVSLAITVNVAVFATTNRCAACWSHQQRRLL